MSQRSRRSFPASRTITQFARYAGPISQPRPMRRRQRSARNDRRGHSRRHEQWPAPRPIVQPRPHDAYLDAPGCVLRR